MDAYTLATVLHGCNHTRPHSKHQNEGVGWGSWGLVCIVFMV